MLKVKRTQNWYGERYVALERFYFNHKTVTSQKFAELWEEFSNNPMYVYEASTNWKEEHVSVKTILFTNVETGKKVVMEIMSLYEER